jgi:pantothenate kinase
MPETQKERDTRWTEWTTNVLSQLMDLNSRYEALERQIASKYEAIENEFADKYTNLSERVERHGQIITGGSEPSKGIVIRLDRLEQTETRRTWWLRSTIAAAVAAIITAAFAVFKKTGP